MVAFIHYIRTLLRVKRNFPSLPIGTVNFCFKGCWVVFFIFLQAKSGNPDQTPQNMRRLIWVCAVCPCLTKKTQCLNRLIFFILTVFYCLLIKVPLTFSCTGIM